MSEPEPIGSCTPEHPMPKGAKGAWGHWPVRDLNVDDAMQTHVECLNCGFVIRKPWPVQA